MPILGALAGFAGGSQKALERYIDVIEERKRREKEAQDAMARLTTQLASQKTVQEQEARDAMARAQFGAQAQSNLSAQEATQKEAGIAQARQDVLKPFNRPPDLVPGGDFSLTDTGQQSAIANLQKQGLGYTSGPGGISVTSPTPKAAPSLDNVLAQQVMNDLTTLGKISPETERLLALTGKGGDVASILGALQPGTPPSTANITTAGPSAPGILQRAKEYISPSSIPTPSIPATPQIAPSAGEGITFKELQAIEAKIGRPLTIDEKIEIKNLKAKYPLEQILQAIK